MKKEYKKPELLFDSFELSASIAGTCGNPINHTIEVCKPIPGVNVFIDKQTCETTPDDVGLCYNIPTPGNTIFTS